MSDNRRVVVTGLGAVTPVGNTAEETWESLKAGRNGIAPITLFDTSDFKAKLGAEVKGFDPEQYMDRNDSLRTDRYTQFAVAAAQQAADDSRIEGTLPPERFSVYFGTGIGGMGTFETEHRKLLERGPRRVSPLFIPMMIANMASGMIAIRHNCRGGAMPAVTACASGSNAVGEAMRMIRHGYADAVIAGGAEASITPMAVAGFVNMQALSTAEDPDAASLPFDRRRGGFVIGEGAAAQVRFETKSTDAVREMALRSGKLVLIDLYATWCPPCRLMEREVFSLREVGEFVEARFVAAKYDVDKHTGRELMRRYGSGSIPLYLVFDTDGNLLGRITGASDAETFMRNLARIADSARKPE